MGKLDSNIDRLLRAASGSSESAPAEMPFAFDTRVVARWRSQRGQNSGDSREFARVFGIIGAVAVTIMAFAGTGAWWQFEQETELGEPLFNVYAIADTAIEAGALQ